jgi:polysaccharide export outer membrane protein
MRIIFALLAASGLSLAALTTSADPQPRSSVDPTLLLSTDVGSNNVEALVSESTTGGVSGGEAGSGAPARDPIAQAGSPQPAYEAADSYRIDTGDGVSVTVYDEPDLSIKDERVKGNGTISYPLLGEIQVRGRTASELQRLVTEMLSDGYLKKPNVTVSIDTFRLFYIKGEVRNPGGFNYVDGLTVQKAVALAGGYTERASKRNITVVRDSDPEQRARQATPGARIQPGDVITVGESFF